MNNQPRVIGAPAGQSCPKCHGPTDWTGTRYGIVAGCRRYPDCDGKTYNPRGPGALPAHITKPAQPYFTPATLAAFKAEGRKTTYADGAPWPEGLPVDLSAWPDAVRDDGTPAPVPAPVPVPKNTPNPTPVPETPMPAPAITPATPSTPAPVATDPAGDAFFNLVRSHVHNAIATAMADVKAGGASEIKWQVNDLPFAESKGKRHTAYAKVMRTAAAGFGNIMLTGPAGSGKTSIAEHLAQDLSRPFASVSCSGGTTESAFIGRAIPNLTSGETAHETTEFLTAYEGGGVILVDEFDAADPTVALLLNAALANGWLPVPSRSKAPRAVRHPDCLIIVACNTWGTGLSRQYVGRNKLDAATLDRFVGAKVFVDYDQSLEQDLTGHAALCHRVWEVRKAAAEQRLERIVGTRFLLAARRWVAAGLSVNEAVAECMTDWTEQERAKVRA